MFLINRSFINRTVGFIVLLAIALLPSCNKDGDKVSVEVNNGIVSISFETPFASDVLYDNIVVTISPDGEGEDIVYESVNDVPEQMELPAGEYLVTIKGTSTLIELFGVVIDDELEIEVIEGESMEYSFSVVGETYDIYWKVEKIQDGCEDDSDPEDIIFRISLTNKDGEQIPNLINRTHTVELDFTGIDEDKFTEDFPDIASIAFNEEYIDIKLTPQNDNDVEGTRTLEVTLSNPSLGSLLTNNNMTTIKLFDEDFCDATQFAPTFSSNNRYPNLFNILSFQIGDFVNETELNPGRVNGVLVPEAFNPVDHKDLEFSLERGKTYEINIEFVNKWVNTLTSRSAIWIDFDQDGTFEDATEKSSIDYISSTPEEFYTSTLTITVPNDAPSGKAKLRAKTEYNTSTHTPCGTGSIKYGEVEDYLVTIK